MADSSNRRPWYSVAIAGGFGAVLAVLFSLGFIGTSAHGSEPQPRAATQAAQSDASDRLTRIENKLSEVSDRLSHIEGRLDRGR